MNNRKGKLKAVIFFFFALFCFVIFSAKGYAQILQFGCGNVGDVEYRYTPQGECGTKEEKRTCCGGGQTSSGSFVLQNWSGWNEDCPELCVEKNPCTSDADCCGGKVCSQPSGVGASLRYCAYLQEDECLESEKPTCSLSNGTCKYNCTCSNGKWTNCTKVETCNSGYRSVKASDGSICCEIANCGREGPNGMIARCICATDIKDELGHRWEYLGTSYNCTGFCPVGTPSDGATCPDHWAGAFCTTHHSWTNRGEEICNQYYCR